jgi:Early transcription elongation factor of RNA pol II, NGN section
MTFTKIRLEYDIMYATLQRILTARMIVTKVLSVFTYVSIPGAIYIEADSPFSVYQLLQGICRVI